VAPPVILIVEDNPDDETLCIRAFREARLANPIAVVHDGPAALDFLYRRGEHADRSDGQPQLVLLDLKLPKLSGLDVLERVRKDRAFDGVPIVVFTSSDDDREVRQAYLLGANSYVRKPVDFDDFRRAVAEVGLYWTVTNLVPES